VPLDAGVQQLRVVMDEVGGTGAVGNLNYFDMRRAGEGAVALQIEAEDFDAGGPGIGYSDLSPGNDGGQYRATDVDIASAEDVGGGYTVGWMFAGEWLAYTVDIGAAGKYTLQARVASGGAGGTFHVEVDNIDVSGTLTIPDTGGWHAWWTIEAPVTLPGGHRRVRVVLDSNGATGAVGNLNYLRLTSVPGS